MDQKFFICKHCGNIVGMIKASGVPLVCCGENMDELVANKTDASVEKHVPEVIVEGNKVTVKVGSAEHPMVPEHFIEWICLNTTEGRQRKALKAGQKPEAVFYIADGEKATEAYSYCNLHSLWVKEVK
jgi:superoxide reductase